MPKQNPIYVVGDVHGHLEKLVGLLRGVELVDSNLNWSGGPAALWFIGDFFDRGPDGIGVVDLVMRLQARAAGVGGYVGALLGNHEPLILAAQRFRTAKTDGPGGNFLDDWALNGGLRSDLARLTPRHVDWLIHLPAMAHAGDRLLIHADSTHYLRYGRSVPKVNQTIATLLQSNDTQAWDALLGAFSDRGVFGRETTSPSRPAQQFLQIFGGRQIVHGHTPISYVTGQPPEEVVQPRLYAGGLCVNVDGGMYLGGPGFVHQFLPAGPVDPP